MEDNTWYIAIMKVYVYVPFVAAGSETYRDWKEMAEKYGMKVVAELFGVTDQQVNRMTGFDEKGNKTDKTPLKDLADRLERGERFDVQSALQQLCQAA